MQQTGLGAASLHGHREGLQREPPVIDRTDRPADDEPRVQVENRGQIQLGVLADPELRGVADPSLIRPGGPTRR
jgi:hypothetical protein